MEKTDLTLDTGELAQERWYLLTSLPPGRCSPDDLLGLFRGHWSIENSRHHVKDRSWDEYRHTRRRPGLGEVFAILVNVSLNVPRQEGWFPERMSLPLRAKSCAFRPRQTIARLLENHPDFAIVLDAGQGNRTIAVIPAKVADAPLACRNPGAEFVNCVSDSFIFLPSWTPAFAGATGV